MGPFKKSAVKEKKRRKDLRPNLIQWNSEPPRIRETLRNNYLKNLKHSKTSLQENKKPRTILFSVIVLLDYEERTINLDPSILLGDLVYRLYLKKRLPPINT